MRDYGGFGDPNSAKTALLIEAGQHWERRAAEVATDVMLRFLIALGTLTRRTWSMERVAGDQISGDHHNQESDEHPFEVFFDR